MDDVSPPKWHLAPVTWFFETFLLKPFLRDYVPLDMIYDHLFNSYYETHGNPHRERQRKLCRECLVATRRRGGCCCEQPARPADADVWRCLGVDGQRDRFSHRAFFNERQSRIEMHLDSRDCQVLSLNARSIRFREGESIHTESSYKYSIPGFQRLAGSGFASRRVWCDDDGLFSVHYLVATLR